MQIFIGANNFYISYKTHGLYCHDLTYCKWANLKKPRCQYDN